DRLVRRRLLLEPQDAAVRRRLDDAVLADLLARHVLEDDRRQRVVAAVDLERAREVQVDQRVAAEDEEGVVEEGGELLNLLQPARGAEAFGDDRAVVAVALEA